MVNKAPVVVIGAGAAGLMAAIAAAAGARVLLLERTHDGGRKILISGGGRCNILPAELQPERFVTASSPNTLRNVLRAWPLGAQRGFFESDLRLPLAFEAESAKWFPASNRARDVRDALIQHARQLGVVIRFDTRVTDIVKALDGWSVLVDGGEPIKAGAVIFATGGLSVPATGSDGSGLAIARRLGHTIRDTYPALTPLLADPAIHAALAGVTVQAQLRADVPAPEGVHARPRQTISRGGFLFTHHGYSGPAVLDLSHVAVRARAARRGQVIQAQWSMHHDDKAWSRALQVRDGAGQGLVVTRLRQHLPNRLADWLLADAGLPVELPLAVLIRAERLALIERLCRYPLPWTGDEGYKKAEVTGGGVALEEVDPRTLESRRHRGIFLCGEMLDAFGPIGGHNFAWAWSTGRAAGLGAAGLGPAGLGAAGV
jgi:predicted Rossmann fold flavoprotein